LPPFSKAHPPRVIILDRYRDDGTDAREGVGHDADQRTITQADERIRRAERAYV
jgi:hypothetical protein